MLVEGLVSTIIPVHNRPSAACARQLRACLRRPTGRSKLSSSTMGQPTRQDAKRRRWPKLIRKFARSTVRTAGRARRARQDVSQREVNSFNILTATISSCRKNSKLQVAGLRQCGDCAISYGKTRFYAYGTGRADVAWKRTGECISTMFPSFLQSRWWDTSTPLYRREVTDLAGPWTLAKERGRLGIRLSRCKQAGPFTLLRCVCLRYTVTYGNQLSSAGSSDPEKLRIGPLHTG